MRLSCAPPTRRDRRELVEQLLIQKLDPTHRHDQFCPIVGCRPAIQQAAIVPLMPLPPPPAPPTPPSLWALVTGLSTRANLVYESSIDLCSLVAKRAVKPAINLETPWPGQPSPNTGHRGWFVASPYELLHAIGQTTRGTNILPWPLSWFSGHWAVAAYLSCFRLSASPPSPCELRLSPHAHALKGRQRAIWSEGVAIGVASLLVQRSLGPKESASQLLDVDQGWLKWAVNKRYVTHVNPKRRPDYLVRRETPGPEIMVIECKGTNGARGSGIRALADAIGQATSVGSAVLPVKQWAVAAACPQNKAGTWHPQVVEVTHPSPPPRVPDEDISTAVSSLERLQSAQLLEAIGDIHLAYRLMRRGERVAREDPVLPEERQLDDQNRGYLGRTLRITFDTRKLEVFLGIDEQIREALTEDAVAEAGALRRQRSAEVRQRSDGVTTGFVSVRQPDEGEASLSAQGTLLSIRAS
jgi:hypothetical protein